MADITKLSLTDKAEIAAMIKADTLEEVNKKVVPVKPRVSFYTKYGKRVLDLLIGLIGFTVSAPINLLIAVITYFDLGRPILFTQSRVGLNEKIFLIYKFRNMTNDTDVNGELLPASQRVTKWGRFVRKTSLDELLNFVSIIKGDMSVIGPRPLLARYADRLNVRHKAIYKVRPGLECPPLHGAGGGSFQDRLENYVWYVENCNFLLDLKLCFRVVALALDRKSAEARSRAGHGGILGYDLDGDVIGTKNVPDQYVERFLKNHGFDSVEEAVEARSKKCEVKV